MAQTLEIIWTDKARNDLKNLFEYWCINSNEEKAFERLEKIIAKVEILINQPLIGQKEPLLIHLKKEYRRLLEKDYKIIYHIANQRVIMNCVFDVRQNPKKLKVK